MLTIKDVADLGLQGRRHEAAGEWEAAAEAYLRCFEAYERNAEQPSFPEGALDAGESAEAGFWWCVENVPPPRRHDLVAEMTAILSSLSDE